MTPLCREKIIFTKPRWKSVFVYLFFRLVRFVYVAICIFPRPMAWYSLFGMKVPVNTNKRNQTCSSSAMAPQLTPAYFTTRSNNIWSSSAVHLDVLMAGCPAFFQNSLQLSGLRWPSSYTHRQPSPGSITLHQLTRHRPSKFNIWVGMGLGIKCGYGRSCGKFVTPCRPLSVLTAIFQVNLG